MPLPTVTCRYLPPPTVTDRSAAPDLSEANALAGQSTSAAGEGTRPWSYYTRDAWQVCNRHV